METTSTQRMRLHRARKKSKRYANWKRLTGTLEERMNKIVKQAIESGTTGWATLAQGK